MPDLIVAGAGMGGLAAAAEGAALGAEVEVREKGDRAGGSMLLSSGVVWRHRDFERFRAECPGGDPALQRVVWESLDTDLAWLESLGAAPRARDTGNPLTSGARFDTAELTAALVRAAGGRIRFGDPLAELPEGMPLVLATGGFQGDRDLLRRHVTPCADELMLRANPWSAGDGMRIGLAAGAELSTGLDEFYGRNMPAPPARVGEDAYVALASSTPPMRPCATRAESGTSRPRGPRSTSCSGRPASPARERGTRSPTPTWTGGSASAPWAT
jgi:hypothetical protein